MKKIIICLTLLWVAATATAQIEGKYAAMKFADLDTNAITTSQSWPIEISGENYVWSIYAVWADSSVLDGTYLKVQKSPDGSFWIDEGIVDTISTFALIKNVTGADVTGKHLRLYLGTATGDTVWGFKAWYEFRRK